MLTSEKCIPVKMILNSMLVSFVLHLGIMLPVTMAPKVNIIAGKTVVLPCREGLSKPVRVVWKYQGTRIIHYDKSLTKTFRDNRSAAYEFVNPDKEDFSLHLPNGEAGQYTCEAQGKEVFTYDLQLWKVKGSHSGYLLQGATLLLEVISSGMAHTTSKIEWLSPHKAKVTGNEPRWKLENNNWTLRIKNLTVQEDNGIWKCHVLTDGLQIPYDVKVIGFLDSLDGNDLRFATVNSSVGFSCPLNIKLSKENNMRNSLGLQHSELVKDNVVVRKNFSSLFNSTLEIPKVQFEDAGKYQCHFEFAKGNLNKSIHLIVMKVSANPPGLHSEKGKVYLCCHMSAPVPARAELCWVNVNTTRCQSNLPMNKFCLENATAGLWRCDLKVKNSVKISMNYTVEEGTVGNVFPLVEILSGAGVLLLLLIFAGLCAFTLKPIKRKRQRARRMAQAKQHLLEKKTCQCERDLTNDYYHT